MSVSSSPPPLRVVVLALLSSLTRAQQQLWRYALGFKDTTYTDYTVVESVSSPETAAEIAAYYAGMGGGFPSLGSSTKQESCEFAWNLGLKQTITCNCGDLPVANDVAPLAFAGGIAKQVCLDSLSAELWETATPNPDGDVALFKSALPPGCDPQCELHGACSATGAPRDCICSPKPANASAFYWTGEDCQILNPGKGCVPCVRMRVRVRACVRARARAWMCAVRDVQRRRRRHHHHRSAVSPWHARAPAQNRGAWRAPDAFPASRWTRFCPCRKYQTTA